MSKPKRAAHGLSRKTRPQSWENVSASPRASRRWDFEKPIIMEARAGVLPPELLDDFIRSGISLDQYLLRLQSGSLISPTSTAEVPRLATRASHKVEIQTANASRSPRELIFSKGLAIALNGETESVNHAGRVDVLTDRFVIEVKESHNWKHGIGQVLVYSHYYPNLIPVLFLIGDAVEAVHALAEIHCNRLGVSLATDINNLK
jgi:hypothetical protein